MQTVKLTPLKLKLNQYEEENAKQKHMSIRIQESEKLTKPTRRSKKPFPFRRITLNTQSWLGEI